MQITSHPGLIKDPNSSPTHFFSSIQVHLCIFSIYNMLQALSQSHQGTPKWTRLHSDHNSERRKWQHSFAHLFNKYLLTIHLEETRFWTLGNKTQSRPRTFRRRVAQESVLEAKEGSTVSPIKVRSLEPNCLNPNASLVKSFCDTSSCTHPC